MANQDISRVEVCAYLQQAVRSLRTSSRIPPARISLKKPRGSAWAAATSP